MKTTFDQFWQLKEQVYTEMGIPKEIAREIWLACSSNQIKEELTEICYS